MKVKFRFWMMLVLFFLISGACRFSDGSPGSPPNAVFADPVSVSATANITAPENTPAVQLPTNTSPPQIPTITVTPVAINSPTSTSESAMPTAVPMTETPEQALTPEPGPVSTNMPTITAAPTQTTSESVATSTLDTATVRLVDQFDGGGGWAQGAVEDSYEFGYVDGVFRFDISVPDIEIWTVRGQTYSDLRQEITITDMAGDVDGYFGLICRWQKPNTYYRFTVTPGGTFKITRIFLAIETDLAEAQLSPFSEFSDQEAYRIRTDCTDSQLLFYLNQQLVLSAEDNELQTGQFGMLAEAGTGGSIQVEVDNYALYIP